MNNPFSLENKTILITGASSGIGRQCAIDCNKMGAKIILVGRNKKRLEEVCNELHGNNSTYVFDLNNLEKIKEFITSIVKENGAISGFIHAAGIEKTLPIKLLTHNDYLELYKVNSLSAFEIIRQLYSRKNFNDYGHIVLISSITSIIGRGGLSAYSASKGAIISAVRPIALEMAKRNICVNCISPGTVLTPMMQNFLSSLTTEEYNKRIDGFPLGLGKTTDISLLAIYLLSDASRWVTGQNFIIDGGYTIK